MDNDICVPNFLAQTVAIGDIISAIDIESPPTKA
jgi:hypothetical protein